MLRLRSAGWLFANQVVMGAAAFASSILVAQELGPSGKGTVTVAQTITGLAGVVLAAGLPGAAGFLAARNRVDGPTESKVAWFGAFLATALTLLVAVPFAQPLADALFHSESAAYLWVAIVAIAPGIAGQVFAGFLLGVGRARDAALVSMGSVLANLVGLIVLALGGRLTISTFLALWLVLLVASALIQTAILLRMPRVGNSASVIGTIRLGARFGAASWASSGLHLLALRLDILLLTALSGSAAVGVYSVGVTFAEVGWYVPNALYGVLFPTVAAEGKQTQEVVARMARIVWPVVLVVGVGLVVLAGLIVVPFYGSAFVGAVGVVAVLVPGMTTGALASVLSAYLGGSGKPGLATVAASANLGVNIALCLILVPVLDEIGAAAASSISYSCAAILMAYFFCRETGLSFRSILLPRASDFSGGVVRLRSWVARGR